MKNENLARRVELSEGTIRAIRMIMDSEMISMPKRWIGSLETHECETCRQEILWRGYCSNCECGGENE